MDALDVRRAGGAIRVAHVPKTIDNDLPLPGSAPTFGFETARHVGVGVVRNLAEDARTTKRWYLVVSMGRAAGHLALGIGQAATATLTIIPEEFRGRPVPLDELCDILIGAIIKRHSQNAPFGTAVLAEGLLGALGEEGLLRALGPDRLAHYGKVERDPHGHLRLGEIEFGRLVKDHLAARLKELNLSTPLTDKDLGYELRCADPIPFDAEYTRDLGYGAVKFLRSAAAGQFGAVVTFLDGRMQPLPFDHLIVPETGRMRPRKVNIEGETYECARQYMIRLEAHDFDEPSRLAKLAAVVGLRPDSAGASVMSWAVAPEAHSAGVRGPARFNIRILNPAVFSAPSTGNRCRSARAAQGPVRRHFLLRATVITPSWIACATRSGR
jgi:6-phosphofructokinase 1